MAKELLKDLIYGEQIITEGCKVEFAVGLTYSLNLEAMLTVPLAFGEFGELDSTVRQNPAFLLEGIRRSSDKMVLFCNKGGIHVPKVAQPIYSLLESSVFEVQNGNDIFSNFHPKLWLVKETDDDGCAWLKLAVMSRNLELSSCLDICCSFRGRIGGRPSKKGTRKHEPLKNMLLWITDNACSDKSKAKMVRELAGQLDNVDRFILDAPFQTEDKERGEEEGYDFYPFVFGKAEFAQYRTELEELLPGDRILVVSPFIDEKTLEWLTSRKKYAVLVARKEYVTDEVFRLFDEVWVPNDTMIDNSTAKIDIHAKLYLIHRQSGHHLGYSLYLGSANATSKGFNLDVEKHPNAECLLCLHYRRTTNDRIKELLEDITSDHRFVKLDAPNSEAVKNGARNDAEISLKMTIGCLKKAEIRQDKQDGLYDIVLSVKNGFDNRVKIRPLQCADFWKPIDGTVFFEGLMPERLSELYVLSIAQESDVPLEMVTKVKTVGMPANRDESIFQSVVTSTKELLDYVAFMLSDSPVNFLFEQQMQKEKNMGGTPTNSIWSAMPFYEQLLKVASRNPEQIQEVQDFVKKMKPEIVPDELKQILYKFQTVSKQISKL